MTATLRFQRPDGTEVSFLPQVPARTRITVSARGVRDLVPCFVVGTGLRPCRVEFSTVVEADVPLVADRTVSWDDTGYGSHAETAMAAPATTWFLAEGATHSGFELFYLLQNPQDTPAVVQVEYLRPAPQTPLVKSYTVAPNRNPSTAPCHAWSRPFVIMTEMMVGGLASPSASCACRASQEQRVPSTSHGVPANAAPPPPHIPDVVASM